MDVNDLVGVPWVSGGSSLSGADCWGLVLLASREIYGVDIGRYEGAEFRGEKLTEIINWEAGSSDWIETQLPRAGDVVTMGTEHIGIMVTTSQVLHSLHGKANGASTVQLFAALNKVYKDMRAYRYVPNNNAA